MDSSFKANTFISEEDNDNPQETGPESPSSPTSNDLKLSPKKGKRSIQKRVVSIPIKDIEGSRLKGESSAPPSDSWAWRKYGQKPIKGSPYPRGYYRCSSSKGCPARKQVERSRVDPTMLLITYSCEHNHPWPTSRNNSAAARHATAITTAEPPAAAAAVKVELPSTPQPDTEPIPGPEENKFPDLTEDSILATGDEFAWFGEMETTLSTVLESPLFTETSAEDGTDVTMFFPMGKEDESLFADLGELPECSVVFRHQRNNVGPEVGIC